QRRAVGGDAADALLRQVPDRVRSGRGPALAFAVERVGETRVPRREWSQVFVAPAAAEGHDVARLQFAVLVLVLRDDCGRDLRGGGPRLPGDRAEEVLHVDDPRPSARLFDRHLLGRHVAGAAPAVLLLVLGEPGTDFGVVARIIEALGGQGVGRRHEVRPRVAVHRVPVLPVRRHGVLQVGGARPAHARPPPGHRRGGGGGGGHGRAGRVWLRRARGAPPRRGPPGGGGAAPPPADAADHLGREEAVERPGRRQTAEAGRPFGPDHAVL